MIRKRLITLGLKPKDARYIAKWFDNNVKSQGPVAALEYFKRVGDTMIGYISGSGYKAEWVKTTQGGYPKSVECLKGYPLEVQLRVAKLARAILLSDPTPSMVTKLREAATAPYKGDANAIQRLSNLIKIGLDKMAFQYIPFRKKLGTVLKSSRTFTNRSVPNGTSVGLDIDVVLGSFKLFRDELMSLPSWEDLFYPLHPAFIHTVKPQETDYVGELGGVMEQGGKLRIFAAPSVVLNTALVPLQSWLDKYREQCSWDVFKNQVEGKDWAQNEMTLGKTLYSIDLSSATCRFPFEVQLELCELLLAPEEFLDLYKKVARGSYKVQPHLVELFGESMTWTVGQPLGLNPSMSSFALCHGLLLVGLCEELGIPHDFRVMGDDVITSNGSLAHEYRQVISSLGISISEHKSYESNSYGEFAGFSITPDVAIRPGRWKRPTRLNILGLVSDLGVHVVDEMDKEYKAVKLLAFRNGTYNPPVSEWNTWLSLNTLIFPVERDYLKCRETKEISWYDGAVAWLTREFKELYNSQPYYVPPKETTFLDSLPEGPVLEEAKRFFWLGTEYATPCYLMSIMEHFASTLTSSDFTFMEFSDFLGQVQMSYEGYLWSLPLTAGRVERDLLAKVETELNAYS